MPRLYSTAEAYAQGAGYTYDVLPLLALPADLTTIEEDAFQGISALGVRIPASVTAIFGNPFAGSSAQYVFGYAGSAAETFANAYGYTFIAVDDAWMASHQP